ncbi:MAG: glycosyltransferase [Candidatus Gracilibacteria bacterium]
MKISLPKSVSAVVLTYKQPDVLNLIIQGLNQQTYRGIMEIIVSDDGSPETVVKENISNIKKSKHDIKYVWQPDHGYRAAAARNNGIRVATNELLVFMDGDIVPHKDFIEKHVMQHTTSNLIVAGNRTWLGEISNIKTYEELENTVPEDAALKRGKKENIFRKELLKSTHPWRACFSANLSVRKSLEVLFDERFIGWGPEDAELCYRLCVNNGYTPIYDESIGAYHLESPDAVGNIFRKNNHNAIVNYLKNSFLFYDKCPGLELEEVFFGLKRLKLDETNMIWSVVPHSESSKIPLIELVKISRAWLQSNHLDKVADI